jgi:hypothetical protein
MNANKGFRAAKGGFPRGVAGAAVLIVTMMCATLWAGPAMAAGSSGERPAVQISAPSDTPSAATMASGSPADEALIVGGILVALVGAVLAFDYGRRQIARRRTDRVWADDRQADDGYRAAGEPWISPPDLPGPAAGPPGSGDEYPSWLGRPYSRWAATDTILRADDHPSWPERQGPPWLDAAPLARPVQMQADFAPQASLAADADLASQPGPMPQGGTAGTYSQIHPEADTIQLETLRRQPEPGQAWDAGSRQLANWIVKQAGQQAAEIRQEAHDQARSSLAEARREAAELIQRVSDQAATTLAAVEVQTADLRAAIMTLSAELAGVTGHVTENLLTSAPSAIQPVTIPVPGPAAEPEQAPEATARTEPAAAPKAEAAAKPKPESAAKPATRPAAVPTGRTRQYAAARFAAIAAAALILFALVSGTTEVALHGYRFFVFRSVGTGETGPSGLQEDQGPGQPDAPGAHLHPSAEAPAGHKAASRGTREP